MTSDYEQFIRKLINLDEKQLIETFHDMLVFGASFRDIERIADCANHFLNNIDDI